MTCCGIEGLEGFKANNFNMNHLLNGDKVEPTQKMQEKNTGTCFRSFYQKTASSNVVSKNSFAFDMLYYYKGHKKSIDNIMGVNK